MAFFLAFQGAIAAEFAALSADQPQWPESQPRPENWEEVRKVLGPVGWDIHKPALNLVSGGIERLGLIYSKRENRGLTLDLFLPPSESTRAPLVVLIHGGGWHSGSPAQYRAHALRFVEYGFAAATIEYRLSDEARHPAAVLDCQEAVRWLKQQADQFNLDRNRVAVFGGSAGAYLAAMLAVGTIEASLEPGGYSWTTDSPLVEAAIIVAGPTYLEYSGAIAESLTEDSNYRRFLGGSYEDIPGLYRKASPALQVGNNTVPVLIIGENGLTSQKKLLTGLQIFQVSHETFVLLGGQHGMWNWEPWFSLTHKKVRRFLDEHLQE